MQPVSAQALLDCWEQNVDAMPLMRTLNLLAVAHPQSPREQLAQWSLGRVTDALLTLHTALFGAHINAVTACPACNERLDLNILTSDIRAPYAESELPPLLFEPPDDLAYTIRLRPLTLDDLNTQSLSRSELIRRCLLEVTRGGAAVAFDALPPPLIERYAQYLIECDPLAEIRFALTCPHCNHPWDSPFDAGSFLWIEVDQWAQRTLREVHLLAQNYGWSEDAILQLSPQRRRYYLELIVAL